MFRRILLLMAALGCLMAAEGLTITVSSTSKPSGVAQNGNANAVAVWVVDGTTQAYTRTVGRWVGSSSNPASANGYLGLTWWRHFTTGNGDVDGYMGATRSSYGALSTLTWNMLTKAGASAPDGNYTVWIEVAINNNPLLSNGASVTYANRASFTFAKNGTASSGTISGTGISGTWSYSGRTVAPTLTAVTPNTGSTAGGGVVTLTGTNLSGLSAVTFGGGAATTITVQSQTQATCVVPAHAAGAVAVVATTAGGNATLANGYTYAVPAPTLTAVTPSGGSTSGGTTVTLTGTDLTGTTAVTFGGTAATAVSVVSATQLTCTTPAHAAGAVTVALTTAGGTASRASGFTYSAPTAVNISGVSPATGTTAGGSAVTITGSGLSGASAVTFGGVAATSVTPVNATTVTCVSPAHAAGAVDVVVTATAGTGTAPGGFLYAVPVPTLTGIAPASASTLGGTVLTLSGTNLSGATAVTVGGRSATAVSVVGATSITCTAPAGTAGATFVVVTTPGGSATAAYTYVVPTPVLTAVSPTSGTILGGMTVTLSGSALVGATAVTFDGNAASDVVVAADGSVTCTAPAHAAGVVAVAVTTPGGTATSTGAFTYVQPPPSLSSVSPAQGTVRGGTTLTIRGANLGGAVAVTVGGFRATALTLIDDGTISCVTPAGAAGLADVVLTCDSTVLTLPAVFTFVDGGGSALVSFTPSSAGGGYAPKQVIAVWIESAAGTFVRTIGNWSNERRVNLTQWNARSGGDADGVMGATRASAIPVRDLSWDLRDRNGNLVSDGSYTLWIEASDDNSPTPGTTTVFGARRTSLAFAVRDGAVATVGPVDQDGFSGLIIGASAAGGSSASSAAVVPAGVAAGQKSASCGTGGIYALVLGGLLLVLRISSSRGRSSRRACGR